MEAILHSWIASLEKPSFGDLLGMVGVLLSLIGFVLTYRQARKSADAAVAAQKAAEDARSRRRVVDVAVSLIEVVEGLSGLKEAVQGPQWEDLPRRIGHICKGLMQVYSSMSEEAAAEFIEKDREVLRSAKEQIRAIEQDLTGKDAKPPATPQGYKAFKRKVVTPLSKIHDDLFLIQLKAQQISARK